MLCHESTCKQISGGYKASRMFTRTTEVTSASESGSSSQGHTSGRIASKILVKRLGKYRSHIRAYMAWNRVVQLARIYQTSIALQNPRFDVGTTETFGIVARDVASDESSIFFAESVGRDRDELECLV